MDLEKLKSLQVLSRKIHSKNRGLIFDIVLFGSSIKGKAKPGDIDIVLILNKKAGAEKLNSIISVFKEAHTEYVFLSELYKEPLWATIIQEGYSLLTSEQLCKKLGFDSYFLFVYDLKNLGRVSKSRFSHALFGRSGSKGILKDAKGKRLGKGCIAVPTEVSEKLRSFFETWKVNYSIYRSLLY